MTILSHWMIVKTQCMSNLNAILWNNLMFTNKIIQVSSNCMEPLKFIEMIEWEDLLWCGFNLVHFSTSHHVNWWLHFFLSRIYWDLISSYISSVWIEESVRLVFYSIRLCKLFDTIVEIMKRKRKERAISKFMLNGCQILLDRK